MKAKILHCKRKLREMLCIFRLHSKHIAFQNPLNHWIRFNFSLVVTQTRAISDEYYMNSLLFMNASLVKYA